MSGGMLTLRQRESICALADVWAKKGQWALASLLRRLARRLYAAERPRGPGSGAAQRPVAPNRGGSGGQAESVDSP